GLLALLEPGLVGRIIMPTCVTVMEELEAYPPKITKRSSVIPVDPVMVTTLRALSAKPGSVGSGRANTLAAAMVVGADDAIWIELTRSPVSTGNGVVLLR